MSPEGERDLPLEIGHVLFVDIVGYSKLLINEQADLLEHLKEMVRGSEQIRAADAAGKLIRLATGDGMALVFRASPEAPAKCALELSRADKQHPELRLRMGIHSGPINEVVDVNERASVTGAGINMAQRVMDCGDAGHILLSQHVADDLEQFPRWRPLLHELGECEVKHGVRLHLVNLYNEELGNPEWPLKLQKTAVPPLITAGFRRNWPMAGLALAVVISLGGLAWWFAVGPGKPAPQPIVAPVAPAVPEKSIAVLPFENLGDDEANARFADGVHDEILTDLSRVLDLKVISRTSTMQYGSGVARNLREIGKALGAANIVEGTVQRIGNRVRVSAQLIDARTDTHLWAERYDRDVANVFALESELAETIVAQLKAKLSPAEKALIEEKPTSDPVAHDFYVRANALIATVSLGVEGTNNLLEAADLLEKAVARDPKYFLAYCRLAGAHDQIYLNGADHTPARLALAESAVKAAQGLRPDAGETHLALAEHYYCGFLDYDRARKELEIAHRLLPNEPLIFELAGFIDRRDGKWDDSALNLERALKLDPRNVYTLQQLAGGYQFQRRHAEAATMFQRALDILPNDLGLRISGPAMDLDWHADPQPLRAAIQVIVSENPGSAAGLADTWLTLALCERDPTAAQRAVAAMPAQGYTNNGFSFPRSWCQAVAARAAGDSEVARYFFKLARAEVEKSLQDEPDYGPTLALLAMIDAALGQKDEAIREGRRAVELLPLDQESIKGAFVIEYLAVTYAWTGEVELALEQLKRAASVPSEVSYGQLRLHPFWDPLRGDPRFEQIVASLAPADGKAKEPR